MIVKAFPVFIFLLGLWVAPVVAQDGPKIDFDFENIPLMQALDFLEESYDLTFAFDQELLQTKLVRAAKSNNLVLHEALLQLLLPQSLFFEVVGGKHVLIRRANAEELGLLPPKEKPLIIACGALKDSLTGLPLTSANVWLQGTQKGAYSNELGQFSIQGPFRERDSLVFSYVGYQAQTVPLKRFLGKGCPAVRLSQQEFAFEQILIRDKAITFLAGAGRGDGLQLDVDQMGVIPGWGEPDALRMAQLLPGISTTDESASNLNIRGGTPDQNLILWDGIPVYHTGHFFGMFSAFNSTIVDEMAVYRGDFSAEYGGRVSGVLDITTSPLLLDTVEVGVGVNLISSNAYVKVPLQKGRSALMVAGRRSISDLFESKVYQNLFNQVAGRGSIKEEFEPAQKQLTDLQLSPKFYFSDFNLKWVIRNENGGEGRISFYQGEDALDYGVLFDRPNFYFNTLYEVDLLNWGLSAKWSQRWNDRWQSDFMFVFTEFSTAFSTQTKLNPEQVRVQVIQSNNISEQRIEWNNTYNINQHQRLNFGYQGVLNEVDLNIRIESPVNAEFRQERIAFQGTTQTFYLDYDYTIPEKLHMDWGLRYGSFDGGYTGNWEPRFSLSYYVRPEVEIKTSIGRYIQVVNQVFLNNNLGIGERFWIMADSSKHIPAVTSAQFTLGARWKSKGWLLDVDFYKKWITGLVSMSLDFDADWQNPYSGGEARVLGMDLLLKKSWPNYDSWLAYTLGRTHYRFDRINRNEPFPSIYDRLHNLKWTHQLKFGNWDFAVAWFYGSGLPYTQAQRGRFVPDEESENGFKAQIEYGDVNAHRLQGYQRIDFSGAYNFTDQKKLRGKIGWSIFNVLDRLNFYSRTYFLHRENEDFNRPVLVAYDRSLLGFTPNLFLELRW